MVMVIDDLPWIWILNTPPPLLNVNWPSHSEVQLFTNLTMKVLGQHHVYSMVKSLDDIWPWKFKDQGHCQCQTWWSHLRPKVQSIYLLFVSWQSDHFGLRNSKLHIWPWKIKVKVMAKVKPDGHIWGLEFNRYVCFSFRGNGTIFGWDIANSMFDLENSRSRSWSRSNLMVTFEAQSSIDMFAFCFVAIGPFLAEIYQIPYLTLNNENRPKSNQVIYRSGPTIVPKMKEIQNVVKKLSCGQKSAACDGGTSGAGGGIWTDTKT